MLIATTNSDFLYPAGRPGNPAGAIKLWSYGETGRVYLTVVIDPQGVDNRPRIPVNDMRIIIDAGDMNIENLAPEN